MDLLGALDITTIPGIAVEVIAASAVIIVVRMFLSFMKENREDQKKTFDEIRSVIDRNTTALALNAETMNRVIEIVSHCRLKQSSGNQ